jgi:ankyrin repeat protein
MKINSSDEVGWTPLFYAAVRGHEIVVKVLLENNADPDRKDHSGLTPLLHVVGKGPNLSFHQGLILNFLNLVLFLVVF